MTRGARAVVLATIGLVVAASLPAMAAPASSAPAPAAMSPRTAVPATQVPQVPRRRADARAVMPTVGSGDGGDRVALRGRHLDGVRAVRFGSKAGTSVRHPNDRRIQVRTPAHRAGPVRVWVRGRGRAAPWVKGPVFQYEASPPVVQPVITAVTPASGSAFGGDRVTIDGTGLGDATAVSFGGSPGQTVTRVSDDQLLVTTPPHPPGAAGVVVGTPHASSAPTATSTYTYVGYDTCQCPPYVADIDPTRGPTTGGTRVTLTGFGLYAAQSVTFDGQPATDLTTSADGRTLTVTTPSHSLGYSDIQVVTSHGVSAAGEAGFDYLPPPPTITAAVPGAGPLSGARITLTGTNFIDVEAVRFGDPGRWGTHLTVLSPTELKVTTPSASDVGTYGAVAIRVQTTGGVSQPTGPTFTYVQPPFADVPTPEFGPTTGGSRVTIHGSGFTGLGGVVSVTFAGVPGTDVEVTSDDELSVTTPAHEAGGAAVVVTTRAGSSPPAPQPFSYEAPTPPVGSSSAAPLPTTDTVGSVLNDAACPSAGECWAVGTFLTSRVLPLVEHLHDGIWTASQLPLPPDADPSDPSARLMQISCPTADFCAAVGRYATRVSSGHALVATWDGSTWTVGGLDPPRVSEYGYYQRFSGLDCLPDHECVAIGDSVFGSDDVAVLDGRSWSWVSLPLDPGHGSAGLDDVDCAQTRCTIVGYEGRSNGADPLIEQGVGSSWTRVPVPTAPGTDGYLDELNAVACWADDGCTAVGSYVVQSNYVYGLAVTGVDGTWTSRRVTEPPDGSSGAASNLDAVACPAVARCVVGGEYDQVSFEAYPGGQSHSRPMVLSVKAGRPTVPRAVAFPNGDPTVPDTGGVDILCRTLEACAVTGNYALAGSRRRSALALVGPTDQRAGQVLDNAETDLRAVSLDNESGAIAVGRLSTGGDPDYLIDAPARGNQAWIVTGLPVDQP